MNYLFNKACIALFFLSLIVQVSPCASKSPSSIHSCRVSIRSDDPYFLLPLTRRDLKYINEIMSTLARTNILHFQLKRGAIQNKVKKIENVHPLRFLGVVCSNEYLKDCLHQVYGNYVKRYELMHDLKPRLKKEHAAGNLLPHVEGFCHEVNKDPEKVRAYINKSDWSGLVKYLAKR